MKDLNQQLVQAIDKLIPEAGLMELKEGQRIIASFAQDHILTVFTAESVFGELIGFTEKKEKFAFQVKDNMERIKILGLEPELRHVLWALDVTGAGPELAGLGEGEFVIESWANDGIGSRKRVADWRVKYDLTASLFNQSEETKQWLLTLLTS